MSKKNQVPVKDPEFLMEFWEAANSSQKKDVSTFEFFQNKNGNIKDGEEITFYYGGENHDLNTAFLNEGVMKNINGAWYIIDQYDTYRVYPDSFFMIEYESIRKLTRMLKIKRNMLKKVKKGLLKTIKFLDRLYFKVY